MSAAIETPSRIRSVSPWFLLILVWLLSALYMGMELGRGWFPHDDGVLAQSAERVLHGEVPHRDFDEIYTGGLSYLNAGAFRLFGTNLASMRYMLYLFFLAWVPSLYFVASRFATSWISGAFTLLAVAWGVPNYSTGMPSWYNLFFATFGIAALFRHIETRQRRWLFVAGLCGGISFLFKLSGMYYVAGAVLFLLAFRQGNNGISTRLDRWACIALCAICVLGYEASVFFLLRKAFYIGSFLYFFLPVLMVGTAAIWNRLHSQDSGKEFESIVHNLLFFGAGVAIPIALFLIVYWRAGAITDFVRGVFVLPGKRLHYTIRTQSLARFLAGTATDTVSLIAVFASPRKIAVAAGSLLVAASAVLLVVARTHPAIYDAAWVPIWNMLPVVTAAGILFLMMKPGTMNYEQQQKTFLLLAVTAACSLIQFPYGAAIYFCYVAPLLAICVLGVGTLFDKPPRVVLVGLFCISLLYAVWDVTPRFLSNKGELYAPPNGADFVLPRAGSLRLFGVDARENAEVVSIVARYARGKYIYATPDCPQVYFLSGFRNPTRTLFDFMDDPEGRTQRILASIHAHDVNLVVINSAAGFSGAVPQDLRVDLEKEFPQQTRTENFEIRWKP